MEPQRWRVRSKRNGTLYTLSRLPNGVFTCDCPGQMYMGGGKAGACKHIRELRASLESTTPMLPEGFVEVGDRMVEVER